jgi:nucleoside 2-deoxyribosyltransferase
VGGIDYTALPLVYLAGPYTRPDPIENTRATILAADDLIADAIVTPFVPHLTALWHLVSPHDLEFWYAYDLAMLARCDAVLRLAGESTGADAEVAFAHDQDIPVFTAKDHLYAWCRQS